MSARLVSPCRQQSWSDARALLGNYAPPQLTESRSSCNGVNTDGAPEARSSRRSLWECFPKERCDALRFTLTASNGNNPNGTSGEDEADLAVCCDPFIASAAVCRGSALCSALIIFLCSALWWDSTAPREDHLLLKYRCPRSRCI